MPSYDPQDDRAPITGHEEGFKLKNKKYPRIPPGSYGGAAGTPSELLWLLEDMNRFRMR